MNKDQGIEVVYVPLADLKASDYNPRKWESKAVKDLKDSIQKFGMVDPIIANKAPERLNIVIGGHFRLAVAKELGLTEIPVVYVNIPDINKEKELNIRLNKNTGEWDWDLLAKFDSSFLKESGFSDEELNNIFDIEIEPEEFNIEKELKKLGIEEVQIKKQQIWKLGDSRLMCGDSTVKEDVLKLYGDERADLLLTDPPYILDYLNGKKKHGEATTGFGYKRDRRYLETDVLPDDFTDLWMANIHEIQKQDFHAIVYENWKNIRVIWGVMEKYWKVKNMIVWHIPNRHQGFSAKYKFFSKHDIAMVGSTHEKEEFNDGPEEELL